MIQLVCMVCMIRNYETCGVSYEILQYSYDGVYHKQRWSCKVLWLVMNLWFNCYEYLWCDLL